MTSIVIALIALLGAIVSSAVVLQGQRRSDRRVLERALHRYQEPLIASSYDLQARLYNILRKDFLSYVTGDTWGRRQTALDTTLFAFAQYFGWREILRREIELLQFETRDIGRILSEITGTMGSDSLGPAFLLWKPEQRAIGELMIGEWRDEPSCVGYLEFSKLREELAPWLDRLKNDLVGLSEGKVDTARLVKVQHHLIELIAALDPKNLRYPPERLKLA